MTLNLTGRRFGRLTAIQVAPEELWPRGKNGRPTRSWLCLCDCSATVVLPTATVVYGSRLADCGNACPLRSEAGRRFGRLVVVAFASRNYVRCRCDCGTVAERVPLDRLRRGTRTHCSPACPLRSSPYHRGSPADLVGLRSGRLTVLGLAPKESWPSNHKGPIRSWVCRCDCGAQTGPITTERLAGTARNRKQRRYCSDRCPLLAQDFFPSPRPPRADS